MPERWLYVTVHSPSGWEAELLTEGLLAAGATGVEQLPGGLGTYFPPPADITTFVTGLERQLRAAAGAAPQLEWEWRADQDWLQEWRRGLAARRVGERLVVTPSWIDAGPATGDLVITIDPQMAFGTGEHATTRGVLRLLEGTLREGDRVLDVGTGSGILAIAAARLGAEHVRALDNDADALINARENLIRNGVADRVALEHGAVDEQFLASHPGTFDAILANVLSSVLRPLLPGFLTVLRPGGALILSGILLSEAAGMAAAARAAGFVLAREDLEDEWWTGLLRPH